ncbi:HAD hydrolase-like protein [Candidatus Kaiserbacteria bacterium]|nr:HAD hydrolase-like protein [Candidatus Kaiserbacteria bacterium]
MSNKYLIFDFDGVIGDTWETVILAHIKKGNRSNRQEAIAEMNSYFSKKPHHTKTHSLSETELANEYKWTSEFGSIMHEIGVTLFDDFVKEIELLPTKYKAVVSSGSQNYVSPALAKTNINPTHILAFEDHHSKEEKIQLVAKDWDAELSEIYYFTDTLADIYELRDIISTNRLIGVSWGFCSKEQLLTELAEENILNSPSELAVKLK